MGKRLDGSSLFSNVNAGLNNTFAQLSGQYEDGLTLKNLNDAFSNPNNANNNMVNNNFASYLTNNFNSVDADKNGQISAEEVQKLMNNIATQGLTREQIYSLASAGMSTSLQETVLSHFDDIDANHDGKVTNQEINAYGVNSDIEKRKIADRNRIVNNLSMFYGDSTTDYQGSIMDYRYLDDENK